MQNVYSLALSDWQNLLVSSNLKRYGADQIFDWLYRKIVEPSKWSNISKDLRMYLKSFDFSMPIQVKKIVSSDHAIKYLFQLSDTSRVETVLIPGPNRHTVCISTQVGCPLKCAFCNTGKGKFIRNLHAFEIVGQYMAVVRDSGIKPGNIVFMGQGEPLLNINNVKQAIRIFMEPKGLGIGARKITVSTAGILPVLETMNDFPKVSLAFSLNGVGSVRDELMPVNKKYSYEKVIKALNKLSQFSKITYEYILISGVNDKKDHLKEITKILPPGRSKVNLIPFNESGNLTYKPSNRSTFLEWQKNLNSKGITCTIRNSRGSDIMAACGQLSSSSSPS